LAWRDDSWPIAGIDLFVGGDLGFAYPLTQVDLSHPSTGSTSTFLHSHRRARDL
jgi:hypothetical protein